MVDYTKVPVRGGPAPAAVPESREADVLLKMVGVGLGAVALLISLSLTSSAAASSTVEASVATAGATSDSWSWRLCVHVDNWFVIGMNG